jgi:2-keto-myo-inositol isomerase
MYIGFNEATTMKCSTLALDVQLCEQVGFHAIELRLDMIHSYLRNHSKHSLLDLFEGRKIRPVNINAIYTYETLFSDQDNQYRQTSFLNEFQYACELASFIGGNALVVCPPLKPDRISSFQLSEDELIDMNVRILSQLAKIAKATETELWFEIIGAEYSSCRTIVQAKKILERVFEKNLKLTLDSYNLYMGNPVGWLNDLLLLTEKDIGIAHINDADDVPLEQLGPQSARKFCGDGILNLSGYLGLLKTLGYDGVVSIETFRPEYWEKPAHWVVHEAYRSTRKAMEKAHCFMSD